MAKSPPDNAPSMLGFVISGAGLAGGRADLLGADMRAAFAKRLAADLCAEGVELVSSELGREAGRAIWILTVRLPLDTFLTLEVAVHLARDPFAIETAGIVSKRVVTFLRSSGRLVA